MQHLNKILLLQKQSLHLVDNLGNYFPDVVIGMKGRNWHTNKTFKSNLEIKSK